MAKSVRSRVFAEVERIETYARRHQYLHKGFFLDLPQLRTKTGAERKKFTTKQLEELQSIAGKGITEYVRYSTDYGEVLSYKEGLAYRRAQKAAIKAAAQEAYRKYVSIDDTIIEYFLEERAWAHSNAKMMEYVKGYVNEVISQPNGKKVLAKALEDAKNDGVMQEIQTYSYLKNIGEVLYSELTPYINSAAQYFETEIAVPIRLAKQLDESVSNTEAYDEIV